MIDKTLFKREINNLTSDKDLYDKLFRLYDIYAESLISGKLDSNSKLLVDEALDYLFSNSYNKEINIPLSFINSIVGQVLFSIKFSTLTSATNDNLFTPADVSIIANKTLSTISLDISTNRLKAYTLGKKTYIIFQKDLISYLLDRNFTLIEAEDKIKNYLLLRDKNIPSKEIKNLLNQNQD